METRRLEYFVVLARERSFRRAAEVLFISQPALSQQIRRLEQDVGTVLIDRSMHPIEVTPAGERLLVRSRRVLEELSEIEGVAEQARSGHVGQVKVGIAPSLMFSAVPDVVGKFRSAHPNVDVTLHREITPAILDQVAEQRLDVGVTFSQFSPHTLRWTKLYDDRFVVVVAERHRLAQLPALRMSDLREETFLMLVRRSAPDLHDATIAACAAVGFTPHAQDAGFQVEGAGYVDQIGLVGAGYGVAVIPAAVATLTIPGVVYRPLVEPELTLPTSMCRSPHLRNASADLFVSYAAEQLCGGRSSVSPSD
ncbi:LysR family transcriptional regulator [Ruania alkalisoli]|uniref:LysR family transcriptional regulator n=1 Tax=Ruania alkalisoli TaxID=2779775 RepID=A0A7M1SSQ3_9MICO|nr:LysR family transcriptional regulator [Ruania alkalisoli]QOR70586.1 LysR family transcriptional regulator [Ruania alkalisoli]